MVNENEWIDISKSKNIDEFIRWANAYLKQMELQNLQRKR